eukprot:3124684-Heterocapsa_arctica.AAC.1
MAFQREEIRRGRKTGALHLLPPGCENWNRLAGFPWQRRGTLCYPIPRKRQGEWNASHLVSKYGNQGLSGHEKAPQRLDLGI